MNVKEKDLVQKALGLAESVGSKVDGLEGEISSAESSLENFYNPSELKKTETSVPANVQGKTIIDINGAGELHFALLYFNNTSTGSRKAFIKLTFDGDFVFYIYCGNPNPYENGGWYGGSACYSLFKYFASAPNPLSYDGYTYSYFSVSRDKYSVTVPNDFAPPWLAGDLFGTAGSSNYISGNCCVNVSDCVNQSTAYHFVATPRPLRFDSSLKIEATNLQTSASGTATVFYKLT